MYLITYLTLALGCTHPVLRAVGYGILARDPEKWFWKAVDDGDLEMVKQCASLMGRDNIDWNWCMAMAAKGGYISIVKYAEVRGANNWDVCMAYAAGGGQLSIVEYAAAKGANDWNRCICHALVPIVEYAASQGANDWNWCMIKAAAGGQLSIVEYAAARGANNWDECIAYASREGRMLIVDFLEQCREQRLNKN
jgi:hypothetical protein